MKNAGATSAQFEAMYRGLLQVDGRIAGQSKVLLVDDVATEGMTLGCAAEAIVRVAGRSCTVVAATAGQMIVKSVVLDEGRLRPCS